METTTAEAVTEATSPTGDDPIATTTATAAQPEPKPTETVEFWKAKAREQEARAKANYAASQRLEEIEAANRTDLEKAVAAAEARGRAEALTAAQGNLIEAEARALAATAKFTDPRDAVVHLTADVRAGAVRDDGTVDTDALAAAITDLATSKPYLLAVTSHGPAPDKAIGPRTPTNTGPNAADMRARMEKGLGRRPAQ